MSFESIRDNLEKVNYEISCAAQKSGRKAGDVKLCAVSKFHPLEDVLDAVKAGQLLFGENRVQEACSKFTSLPPEGQNAELHIIGTLQTNKAKKAAQIASCIQSVDSEKLLFELEKHLTNLDKQIDVFLEVHTGEDSKAGFKSVDELKLSLEHFAHGLYAHMNLRGLMTMAPFVEDEKLIRNSFSTLRKMREDYSREFGISTLTELSMGMSGDFKIAIEEGSTLVRVGTAIFGERDYGRA